MQSNKSSKKPGKIADSAASTTAGTSVAADTKLKSRTSRSSAPKSEVKAVSPAHYHKLSASPVAEALAVVSERIGAEVKSSQPASYEQIAELAHKFWADRGYVHGFHEEDWLRAERLLASTAKN
jgi:Protein of unknown function (DUF2934)